MRELKHAPHYLMEVSIVIKLWDGRQRNQDWNADRGKIFWCFPVRLWSAQPPIVWVPGTPFPEVKQSGREADH
jgi:hypothetical protein